MIVWRVPDERAHESLYFLNNLFSHIHMILLSVSPYIYIYIYIYDNKEIRQTRMTELPFCKYLPPLLLSLDYYYYYYYYYYLRFFQKCIYIYIYIYIYACMCVCVYVCVCVCVRQYCKARYLRYWKYSRFRLACCQCFGDFFLTSYPITQVRTLTYTHDHERSYTYASTHTHTHTYIYIYIYWILWVVNMNNYLFLFSSFWLKIGHLQKLKQI